MVDETPYIIVDNQKIAPLHRGTRERSAPEVTRESPDQSFGVVDRVTISKAAIRKLKEMKLHHQAESPSPPSLPEGRSAVVLPLLTYPPKKTP